MNKIEEELMSNEVSDFDEIQVNKEVEQPLFIRDYECLEAEDNKSGGDITSDISTELITKTVKTPNLCRIEGKTFSIGHLKQFLKKIYHRNEDGFFSSQNSHNSEIQWLYVRACTDSCEKFRI